MTLDSATRLPGDPRPVYVSPADGIVIAVEDGALRFSHPRHADRYIPLRHVSRLIVPHTTQMGLDVLCACARRGVPVIVQDPASGALLRAVGTSRCDTGLRQRLLDLTMDIHWQSRLEDWYRANRARIARILARRLRAPEACSGPAHLHTWLEARAVQLGGRSAARATQKHLETFATAFMQQALLEQGLDARSEAWLHDQVDLPAMLGDLLAFQLQPLRLGWLQRRHEWRKRRRKRVGPVSHRAMVRLFERHRGRATRSTQDLINRLHRWLVEIA